MTNSPLYPNTCQVPNVIFDYVMPKVSHAEFKVVMAVVRKTYGWNKESDWISLRQIMKMTGVSNRMVIDSIRKLEWLIRARKVPGNGHVEYSFNIDKNGKLIVDPSGEVSSPGSAMVAYLSGETSSPLVVKPVHQSGETSSPTKGTTTSTTKNKDATAALAREFVDWFCGMYKKLLGQPYVPHWGMETDKLKPILAVYTLERAKEIAEKFLRTKEEWYQDKRDIKMLCSHWQRFATQGVSAQDVPSVPVWHHPDAK